jgi:hypothetical protein
MTLRDLLRWHFTPAESALLLLPLVLLKGLSEALGDVVMRARPFARARRRTPASGPPVRS